MLRELLKRTGTYTACNVPCASPFILEERCTGGGKHRGRSRGALYWGIGRAEACVRGIGGGVILVRTVTGGAATGLAGLDVDGLTVLVICGLAMTLWDK